MDEKIIDLQRTVLRLKVEKFILYHLRMDYCPEISGSVYIYGAGKLGKMLLRCFEKKPAAFIDSKDGLGVVNGVPALCVKWISPEQFKQGDTVIVTPVWAFDEINGKLLHINSNLKIVSLEKILEKI